MVRFFLCLFILVLSCGTNTFEQLETSKDPAEEATRALEEGKPSKARSIMEKELESDTTNYQYISILASAKAQEAGIDTMEFALSLAESGGGDSITGLFGVVPTPTESSLTSLDEAVNHLNSIPSASQTQEDQFKAAIFSTCLMTMRVKILDTDGDGSLSDAELISNLTVDNAASILSSLTSAETAIAGYGASDGTTSAVNNISTISSSINSQSGSTDAEKLQNYLSSSGS